MKKIIYPFLICLALMWMTACDRDTDMHLVDASYQKLDLSCGYDFEIPVLTTGWKIEYVRDESTGQEIPDTEGRPLALEGFGSTQAANGWLTLERNTENSFILRLKENLTQTMRNFTICLAENGRQDYIRVTQTRGKSYKLVKADFREIENLREIYQSDEGCSSLTLTNPSNEPVWEPDDAVFKDVVYSSEFRSDDPVAFDWVAPEGREIDVPHLYLENAIGWIGRCLYQPGITLQSYQKATDFTYESKTLVPPHTTLYLRGEVVYCKRVCHYTFTIENESSGSRFDVQGVWTQIVPTSKCLFFSDTAR